MAWSSIECIRGFFYDDALYKSTLSICLSVCLSVYREPLCTDFTDECLNALQTTAAYVMSIFKIVYGLGKFFTELWPLRFTPRGNIKYVQFYTTSIIKVLKVYSEFELKQAVLLGGRHNMPPPHHDFWPFDLEIGVGVACDLGYPCAKFRLPRPFGFRVRADVRDIRQTDGRRMPMTA